MDVLMNRRLHLVLALSLTAVATTANVLRLVDLDYLAPRATHICLGLAAGTAAVFIALMTRVRTGFTATTMSGCALLGAILGGITEQTIYTERPFANLSFCGYPCTPAHAVLLGACVGLLVGLIVSAFAWVSRRLTRETPELSCVLAWTLAATSCLAIRELLLVLTCVGAAGLHLAARHRRPKALAVGAGPYR